MGKYSLPWTHNAFQESTTFELLTEFYEDLFDKDPKASLEVMRGESGEIEFEETGDPLIDKWEQELRMGLEPDLTEGMSAKDLARMKAEKEKIKRAKSLKAQLSDIDEKLFEAMERDPMYKGKSPLGRGVDNFDIKSKLLGGK